MTHYSKPFTTVAAVSFGIVVALTLGAPDIGVDAAPTNFGEDAPSPPAFSWCSTAMADLKGLEENCPEVQGKRTKESCGNDRCKSFISSITNETMSTIGFGLSKCTDDDTDYKNSDFQGTTFVELQLGILEATRDCGLPKDTIKFRPTECADAINNLLRLEKACPKDSTLDEFTTASCGSDTCKAHLKGITDADVSAMAASLSGCEQKSRPAGIDADEAKATEELKNHIVHIATSCGHDNDVNVVSPACANAIKYVDDYDIDCPKQCEGPPKDGTDKDEATSTLPVCKPGQQERTPRSCGTKKCRDRVAAVRESKFTELANGFKTCKGEYADYATGLTADPTRMKSEGLLPLVLSCGVLDSLDSSVTISDCMKAETTVMEFDRKCPRSCNEGTEPKDGLPACNGAEERSPKICGNPTCENFLEKISANDDLWNQLETCGPNTTGAGIKAEWENQGGAQFVKTIALFTAVQCGIDKDIDAGPCMNGFKPLMKMDKACPKACRNDNDEGNQLPKCKVNQKERTIETCGTGTCKDFLTGLDDNKITTMTSGLTQCTGAYSGLQNIWTKSLAQMAFSGIARDCGLEDSFTATPTGCMVGVKFFTDLERYCPRDCKTGDDENDKLKKCAQGQLERGTSCGTDKCKNFIRSFDDNKLVSVVDSLKQCSGPLKNFADMISKNEHMVRQWIQGVAFGCEMDIPFSKTTCEKAYEFVTNIDKKCKKSCRRADDTDVKNIKLPVCRPGQDERDGNSCGTQSAAGQECASFLTKLNPKDVKSQLAACSTDPTGLASYRTFADQMMPHVDLTIVSTAISCGFDNKLDKSKLDPCMTSLLTIKEFESACPAACTKEADDVSEHLPLCASNQAERTIKSCRSAGPQKCKSFIQNINPNVMAAGFATCSGHLAGYKQYTESLIKSEFLRQARSCGYLDSVNYELDTCSLGLKELWQIDRYCPKTCVEDPSDNYQNLPLCAPEGPEWTSKTCQTCTCKKWFDSLDTEAVSRALSTCNRTQNSWIFDGGLDTKTGLETAGTGIQSSCGITNFACDKCAKALSTYEEINKHCPPTAPQSDTYTKASCGNSVCQEFLANMKDTVVDELANDLQSCSSLNIDLSKDQLALVATSRAWDCGFSEDIGFTLNPCLAAIQTVKSVDDACPEDTKEENTKESCGTNRCSAAISQITEAKFQEVDSGIQSCFSTYSKDIEAGNMKESDLRDIMGDKLKEGLVKLAYKCDLMPSLKVTVSECLAGAKFYYDVQKYCPGVCDDDGDWGLPACRPGQQSRTPDTCGNMRCQEFLKSAPSASVLAGQLASCSGNSDPDIKALTRFGEEDIAEGLASIAEDCGFSGSVRADTKCLAAVKLVQGLDINCPRSCTESIDDSGLPVCSSGQDERSVISCGNSRCKEYLTSVSPNILGSLASDLSTCKSDRFRLQISQEDLEYAFVGAAYDCDFADATLTAPVKDSLTTCTKTSIKIYDALIGTCKQQCGQTGLRACKPGEEQLWSVATCGTQACKSKLQGITSAQGLYDSVMKCTGKFKKGWVDLFGSNNADAFKFTVAKVESDCGHEGAVQATDLGPCVAAERQTRAILRACPRQCAKFIPEDGVRRCDVGIKEFEGFICGTDECAEAISGFTNTKINEIATNAKSCPNSNIDLSSLRQIKASIVKTCLVAKKDAAKEQQEQELEKRFKEIEDKLKQKDQALSAAQAKLSGLQEKVNKLEEQKKKAASEQEKADLESELKQYKDAVATEENAIKTVKAGKKAERETAVKAQLDKAPDKKAYAAVLRTYAASSENDSEFDMEVSLADVIDLAEKPVFKKIQGKKLKMKRIFKSKDDAKKAPVKIDTTTSSGNEELYFPIDSGDSISMELGDCKELATFTGLASGMVEIEARGITSMHDSGEEAQVKACGWKYNFLVGSVTTAGSEQETSASTGAARSTEASYLLAAAATLLTALLI